MYWRKGKIDKLIFGRDGLVRGLELLVHQLKKQKLRKIKRPVQMVTPSELCDPNESAETHRNNDHLKTLAATNVGAIRQASDHQWHEMSPGECGNP